MDSFLAELYGTNEPTEQDFEKVAHLDFLQKVAEEEGIDLDELSDEDLEELAEVAAEAMEEGEEYEDEDDGEEYEEEDLEKEAEAKVEEADFLGRVMAHSLTQELDNIEMEKEAAKGGRVAALRKRMGRGYAKGMKAMKRGVGRAAKKTDVAARRLGKRLGGSTVKQELKKMPFKQRAVHPVKSLRGAMGRAAKSQRMRGYGAPAAATLGLAGAGLGAAALAGRRKEKKSADEMWEDAIQARAWEHLMAAGLADDQGNYIPAEELDKTAGTDDMDYQVDAAALELLEAEGYPVEWY